MNTGSHPAWTCPKRCVCATALTFLSVPSRQLCITCSFWLVIQPSHAALVIIRSSEQW